jgi:hypothetical protein
VDSSGDCSAAKAESHDPIAFGDDGSFTSPVEGVIRCSTSQNGCQLDVHCIAPILPGAAANLDATLSPDGDSLSGTGRVTGSYRGCTSVTYDVTAQKTPSG